MASAAAQWYYYLQNDPRNIHPDGWYRYEASIESIVEGFYQQHHVNPSANAVAGSASGGASKKSKKTKARYLLPLLASSGFQYEVDFQAMTQVNTTSRKSRPICRITNSRPPVLPPPRPSSRAAAAQQKSDKSKRPGICATRQVTAGGGEVIDYTAPEVLHEVRLDETKIFENVAPPTGKPPAKVIAAAASNSGKNETNKQSDCYANASYDDECVICLDSLWKATDSSDNGSSSNKKPARVVSIKNCNHRFHYDCIREALTKGGGKCPLCSKPVEQQEGATKTSKGKCPSGTMEYRKISSNCSGFGNLTVGTIVIEYSIPGGIQKSFHSNPGTYYSGAFRTAYIPATAEGWDLLVRMQYSFGHGLMFTVGTSLTSCRPNVVTWASIHNKTNMSGGTYGYPDSTYFARCNDEMNSLGVPPPAECRQWLQSI